jgi:hypothetical protein
MRSINDAFRQAEDEGRELARLKAEHKNFPGLWFKPDKPSVGSPRPSEPGAALQAVDVAPTTTHA